MIRSFTILSILLFSAANAQSQPDSLSGFDEAAAIRASISENFTGHELKVHLNQLKRNYINDKFGLRKNMPIPFNPAHKIAVAACVNEDFESSTAAVITTVNQVNGWSVTRGYNTGVNNNCNLNGCCPSNPSESSIISAPSGYIDSEIGSIYPIYSVFGTSSGDPNGPVVNPQITSGMYGDNFIRINSNIAGDYSLERLSKTFAVSASNALFRFAFIAVQSSGHQCCDAGGFILKLTNVTTSMPLSSVSYSSSGVSASCSSTTGVTYYNVYTGTPAGVGSGVIFNKWHVNYIDLSPYAGQNINIEVTAGDCTAGGHFAYAYFDAQCGPIDIEVDGEKKNASCMTTATLSGPSNLNAYQWSGPAGFSSSAPSFTTTTPGIYSLTIPQNPPYQPLQQNLNLVFSPANILLSASKPGICPGDSLVLNGTGLSVYSWGSGESTASITVKPNTTTTYTLTGTNIDDCPGFAIITVPVFPSATVGVSSSNSLVCPGESVVLIGSGLNVYSWTGGGNTPTVTVNPNTTTTYTLTGATADNCEGSAMITVNVTECTTTGLQKNNADINVSLFPNPNKGEFSFNIDKSVKKAELRIMNNLGQVVYSQAIQKGENKIKTQDLASGVYYYSVTENLKTIAQGKFSVE